MVKHNLNDIFSDLNSESSVILPKFIKIKNIKSVDTISNTTSSFMPQKEGYSDATSSFMPQKGGYSDATSSFMPQKGGHSDATSSFMPQKGGHFSSSNKKNKKDIKQLISMLSPTSDNNYTANYTANSTDTEQLRNKLFNILQDGGDVNEYLSSLFTSAAPPKDEDPAMRTDHTHIIYTCCLIDLNVVKKLATLKNENSKKGKVTRIYMNTNPFNIWGSSFANIAFGADNYKGIKYLGDLFKEGGLLSSNFIVPFNETYDNAILFIESLRNNGIILFDSADYLLKPFLYNKFITKDDTNTLIDNSPLLKTQEEKDKLRNFLDKEIEERNKNDERNKTRYYAQVAEATNKGEILLPRLPMDQGIAIPYEWYKEILGPSGVIFEQGEEVFGLKKAKKEAFHPLLSKDTDVIRKMAQDYEKLFVNRFKTPEQKKDPIRSIEHRRVMMELIDNYFPIGESNENPLLQTEDALLNKALKALIFDPSIYNMKELFETTNDQNTRVIDKTGQIKYTEIFKKDNEDRPYIDKIPETHKAFIKSIPQKNFEMLEKWISTYYFTVQAPKVYFDFTGLLFICTNLSNKDFLNKQSEEEKKKNKNIKIMNIDKIQNKTIIECNKLKDEDIFNKDIFNFIKKKLPNAYIIDLIRNIKNLHRNLKDFTILTDLEGDDLTAIITAYNFFPRDIKLNIIIQESRELNNPKLMVLNESSKPPLIFKEESLQAWCRQHELNSSLLTVDSMINFLINDFKVKYEKATFDSIPIDYESRIPIIHELFNNEVNQLNTYMKINTTELEKLNEKEKLIELNEKMKGTILEFTDKENEMIKKRKRLKDIKDMRNGTTLEFFEYMKIEGQQQTKEKILQPVIRGISPNICKVADALLQMYMTDEVLIKRLVENIKMIAKQYQPPTPMIDKYITNITNENDLYKIKSRIIQDYQLLLFFSTQEEKDLLDKLNKLNGRELDLDYTIENNYPHQFNEWDEEKKDIKTKKETYNNEFKKIRSKRIENYQIENNSIILVEAQRQLEAQKQAEAEAQRQLEVQRQAEAQIQAEVQRQAEAQSKDKELRNLREKAEQKIGHLSTMDYDIDKLIFRMGQVIELENKINSEKNPEKIIVINPKIAEKEQRIIDLKKIRNTEEEIIKLKNEIVQLYKPIMDKLRISTNIN